MTFLIFVAAFVALACLGVPLLALGVIAVLRRPAAGDDDQRDSPATAAAPPPPESRPVDFSGTTV